MEEVCELPAKKRKIEESTGQKAEGDLASENHENITSPVKAKPVFQIKSSSLARLRQAAKNLSPSKNTQIKDNGVAVVKDESRDKNQNDESKENDEECGKKARDVTNGGGSDMIISSAGSSPAHSPKPEDLTVLSTPPKQSITLQNQPIRKPDVPKNLNDRFEDSGASTKEDDKMADSGKDESSQGGEKHSQSEKNDSEVEMIEIEKKEEEKNKAGDDKEEANAPVEKPKIDFNSVQLKRVLKAMIDDKFKQVEELYQTQGPENELYGRIARLEDENRSLQEYATKLEKAIKLLLNNQRCKKERLDQSVQTDEMVSPRPTSAPNKTASSTVSKPHSQLNHVNKPGNSAVVTSRLTSTQAPIPGHSVRPESHPQQRVLHQQPQVRPPSSSGQGPQGQALFAQRPPQPPQPQYMQNIRQSVPQGSVAGPRRPNPVTVTVHPQTIPQTKTNVILSPGHLTQVQKSTYATSVRPSQPVQQPQQFVPNPGVRPPGGPPIVMHHSPTAQPVPGVVPRPAPTQQGGPPGMPQYSNAVGMKSPPISRPLVPPNLMRPTQGPVANNSSATSPRLIQNVNSPSTNRQPTPQSMTVMSPREQGGLAQTPAQPGSNSFPPREQPPRPIVSIAVVSNGIVLSWNMQNMQTSPRIVRYQLFALQDMGANNPPSQWKKIGVVNALPLPMACTLTQFMPGNKYHFTVRAQDEQGRCGPLSEPCTITLT